jgi:hypothetical protein
MDATPAGFFYYWKVLPKGDLSEFCSVTLGYRFLFCEPELRFIILKNRKKKVNDVQHW